MSTEKDHKRNDPPKLAIRLDDLRPKDNVVGGKKKVVFGIIRTLSVKKNTYTRNDA